MSLFVYCQGLSFITYKDVVLKQSLPSFTLNQTLACQVSIETYVDGLAARVHAMLEKKTTLDTSFPVELFQFGFWSPVW